MEKIKKNWNLIICLLIMCILTLVMFFYIDKKEGFHEDEIFSYTASNSKYANILLSYAIKDNTDTILKSDSVLETIQNLVYYIGNFDEYQSKEAELISERTYSIWRTNEEATECLQIDSISEIFDFFTVYWHTARDVHPPLFYFVVHIVSCLFFGTFSKYIIFLINLVFFLGTCVILIKIMKKLCKNNLEIPTLILYGFSIGAISTVMFQRMYMMLTFFTVYFLYTNLKIYYNDFTLNKSLKIELCIITILGFLTQYYFCVYAAFVAIIMLILMFAKKISKKDIVTYIMQFVKSAIIGVILFIPSIYHIFFSYRSINGTGSDYTFLEKFISLGKSIFDSFSLSNIVGIIVTIILAILIIIESRNKENRKIFGLLIIPVILSFIVVCKLSPYKSMRYIMNLLPIIAIVVIIVIDNLFKNKKASFAILTIFAIILSIYGLCTNNVKYLYKGYNEYLKVAKEYSEYRYVLVCSTEFNHILDLPEMTIYKESLIIDSSNLDELKENSELQEDGAFILSIKNWMGDTEEILQTVLENTGFSSYELLLESNSSANCDVYLLEK